MSFNKLPPYIIEHKKAVDKEYERVYKKLIKGKTFKYNVNMSYENWLKENPNYTNLEPTYKIEVRECRISASVLMTYPGEINRILAKNGIDPSQPYKRYDDFVANNVIYRQEVKVPIGPEIYTNEPTFFPEITTPEPTTFEPGLREILNASNIGQVEVKLAISKASSFADFLLRLLTLYGHRISLENLYELGNLILNCESKDLTARDKERLFNLINQLIKNLTNSPAPEPTSEPQKLLIFTDEHFDAIIGSK